MMLAEKAASVMGHVSGGRGGELNEYHCGQTCTVSSQPPEISMWLSVG